MRLLQSSSGACVEALSHGPRHHPEPVTPAICSFSTFCYGAPPVSGCIIPEIDAPNRHCLDQGLGVRAQDSHIDAASGSRVWVAGKVPRYFLVSYLTKCYGSGTRLLHLLIEV